MSEIAVDQFAQMSAPLLRLTEAKYLFNQFKAARNAKPNHGLFLLKVYFDSLLFCLVSIEEMVDKSTRAKLHAMPSFLFFKALRNVTAHHSVLSGIKGKFPRPIPRNVSVGIGCHVDFSEQFFVLPDRLRDIFDTILQGRPREKRTLDGAKSFLSQLEATGKQIMVVDVVETVILEVEQHVA